MAWYKEWFGEEYLELYAHRDAGEADRHVGFVTQHLGGGQPRGFAPGPPRGGPAVLDLACGAGRHTDALRRYGYRALGMDLSITLLGHPPRVPSVAADMRRLPFADATFDWVLNFFTSFGYFERERENFRVLEEIVRVLAPEGRYLIDFMNRDSTLAGLKPRETQEVAGRRVEIERWYDATSGRINKRIRLSPLGGIKGGRLSPLGGIKGGRLSPLKGTEGGEPCATDGSSRTYLESVRAYSREEVTIGLRWAGLEVDATFGNFHGDPFDSASERLIIVGHKPA